MFPNSIEVFKLDFTFNIIKTLEYLVLNRDVSEFVFKFIPIHFHVAVNLTLVILVFNLIQFFKCLMLMQMLGNIFQSNFFQHPLIKAICHLIGTNILP